MPNKISSTVSLIITFMVMVVTVYCYATSYVVEDVQSSLSTAVYK